MDVQLRRYYLTAAGVLLATTAVSLLWRSPKVTLGAAAGVVVSAVPFATWHLVVSVAGLTSGRRKSLVIALIMAKYAVVAGALWALFRFGWVEPFALAAGVVAGSLAILGPASGGAKT